MGQDLDGAGRLEQRPVEREPAPQPVRRDPEQEALGAGPSPDQPTEGFAPRLAGGIGFQRQTRVRHWRNSHAPHPNRRGPRGPDPGGHHGAGRLRRPTRWPAKPKHDLVAKGKEIASTDKFLAYGKVTTFPSGKVRSSRKVGGGKYRVYKKIKTKANGKFSTRIYQAGRKRTCFKVQVPATATYKKTTVKHRLHLHRSDPCAPGPTTAPHQQVRGRLKCGHYRCCRAGASSGLRSPRQDPSMSVRGSTMRLSRTVSLLMGILMAVTLTAGLRVAVQATTSAVAPG